MIVTLPLATIKRVLDRVTNLPEQSSPGLFVPGIFIATPPTTPGPRLPENVVRALEKARDDKTQEGDARRVGHLGPYDLTALSDWCRAMRLGSDAAAVDAAVRASR
jgi:hypothetical protein